MPLLCLWNFQDTSSFYIYFFSFPFLLSGVEYACNILYLSVVSLCHSRRLSLTCFFSWCLFISEICKNGTLLDWDAFLLFSFRFLTQIYISANIFLGMEKSFAFYIILFWPLILHFSFHRNRVFMPKSFTCLPSKSLIFILLLILFSY